MKTEQIVRGVLDLYVGSQINIDSNVARDLLAKHITAELEGVNIYVDDSSSSD
jgi:hypothetical protein